MKNVYYLYCYALRKFATCTKMSLTSFPCSVLTDDWELLTVSRRLPWRGQPYTKQGCS